MGQVPVKVRGPVRAGDFIIPSGLNDGTGVAVSPEDLTAEQVWQIVATAWESSDDSGLKKINAVVGLNRPELVISKLMQTVQEQRAELNELNKLRAKLQKLEFALQKLDMLATSDQ